MSGQCRCYSICVTLMPEFAQAQKTLGLSDDMHDVGRLAIESYNDRLAALWATLKESREKAAALARAADDGLRPTNGA